MLMLELIKIIVYRGQDVFSEHPVKKTGILAQESDRSAGTFRCTRRADVVKLSFFLSFSDISLLTSLGVNLYQML